MVEASEADGGLFSSNPNVDSLGPACISDHTVGMSIIGSQAVGKAAIESGGSEWAVHSRRPLFCLRSQSAFDVESCSRAIGTC